MGWDGSILTKIVKGTCACLPVGEPTSVADESLPALNSPWILRYTAETFPGKRQPRPRNNARMGLREKGFSALSLTSSTHLFEAFRHQCWPRCLALVASMRHIELEATSESVKPWNFCLSLSICKMQKLLIYFRGQFICFSPTSNHTYVETLYILKQVFKCLNLNTKDVPLKLDYFLWIEPDRKKSMQIPFDSEKIIPCCKPISQTTYFPTPILRNLRFACKNSPHAS